MSCTARVVELSVMKFRVPRSSSAPHRLQFDSSSNMDGRSSSFIIPQLLPASRIVRIWGQEEARIALRPLHLAGRDARGEIWGLDSRAAVWGSDPTIRISPR